MANELYRITFHAEPVILFASDPLEAMNKARETIGTTVRPATYDETLSWMSSELEKMLDEVGKIENRFKGIDCE